VLAECDDERIVGRVELTDSLVAASEVQKTKDSVERKKIVSEERAGHRTLWVSVTTAVISAAATIGVALIAHIGGGGNVRRENTQAPHGMPREPQSTGHAGRDPAADVEFAARRSWSFHRCLQRASRGRDPRLGALAIAFLLVAEPAHAAEHRSMVAYICKARRPRLYPGRTPYRVRSLAPWRRRMAHT
jgi:hypothetical protein